MNKYISFKDPSFENNESNEDNIRMIESNDKVDKVLCNHCGRTVNNGIRCLGICVADNDY